MAARVGAQAGRGEQRRSEAGGIGGDPAEGAGAEPAESSLEQALHGASGQERAAPARIGAVGVAEALLHALLLETRQTGVEEQHGHEQG